MAFCRKAIKTRSGHSFITTANVLMDELQYIPPTSLVFAHPLLKNATLFKVEDEDIENETEKKENDAEPAEEDSPEFFDPLGVSHSRTNAEIDMTKIETPSVVVKETAETRLDNTLAEKQEEFTPRLDPTLAGFRPWSEIREKILEIFKPSEKLSLSSTVLEAFMRHQRYGKDF